VSITSLRLASDPVEALVAHTLVVPPSRSFSPAQVTGLDLVSSSLLHKVNLFSTQIYVLPLFCASDLVFS
jgi:hypothetical protein